MAYKETHNRFTDLWLKFVIWREHHIKEKNFVIFLALIVGIACGFAAQLLKFLIHLIAHALTSGLNTTSANWLYLVYPVIGILIVTLFLKFVVKDNISHGVTKVMRNFLRISVARHQRLMRVHPHLLVHISYT